MKGSVVFVTQAYPPDKGGNSSRIHDLSRYLHELGWSVTVVAPHPSYPHGEFGRTWRPWTCRRVDGVDVVRLWTWQPTARDPGFLSRLMYYLLFPLHAAAWMVVLRGHDVLVSSSPPIFTALPGFVWRLAGKPWVVDVRDLWIDASVDLGFVSEGGVAERLSRWLQGEALDNADLVTVTTREMRDRVHEDYGVGRDGMRVVPNGVDTSVFTPGEGGGSSTVVYAGNFGHAQDLESCVEAMRYLDGVELLLVGGGDLEDRLREMKRELGLNGAVEFVGFVDRSEVPGYLRDAAVGLAPIKDRETLEYAVPTKAYEYMACGLPVVGTGSGEIERLLEESGGGVVADNTPEAIAAAVERLLEDEGLRRRMARQGERHVSRKYSRRGIAERFSNHLEGLVTA